MTSVVDIACGRNHSIAVTSEGQIYSWGYGSRFVDVFCFVILNQFEKKNERIGKK